MYRLAYISSGAVREVKGDKESLEVLLRHLFAAHNNYKGGVANFELLHFGEIQ
mgnify:CR=1|tara:strand:- start:333 stop:491 length:159 start_codon:yes stop_codon:yes gene_type:complete